MKPICVMTIAGSDSSCGAGIQADLKTFSALGVYGLSVITAITSQNTVSIRSIQEVNPQIVKDQIEALFEDFDIRAIKLGMLYSKEIVEIIAPIIEKYKSIYVIVDPIIISSTGRVLLEEQAIKIVKNILLPLAYIITPNINELKYLTGIDIFTDDDIKIACKSLNSMIKTNILVTGGHRINNACDILFNGKDFNYFTEKKIGVKEYHGTGCTLSAAITAYLAHGCNIIESIEKAKRYVSQSILNSYNIGKGLSILNHFWEQDYK